jgi:hypothetical protein
MSEDQREEALRALEQSFGERVKRGPIRAEEPGTEEALASVFPMSAEEVELLAQVAARHSVPLVAPRSVHPTTCPWSSPASSDGRRSWPR